MNNEVMRQMKMISAAFSQINRMYMVWSQDRGISNYAVNFFYTLAMEGSLTQKEFIAEYHLPKQTANNVILAMKKNGYITMTAKETDRREKIIVLTEKGRAHLDERLAPLFRIEEAVVKRMGLRRMRQFIECMGDFGRIMEEEMDKAGKKSMAKD